MSSINDIGLYLFGYLVDLGFNKKIAAFITALSAHETGNFSSKIFRENNNLFGMKYAGQILADGEQYGHALYDSIEDSIKDFETYYKNSGYPEIYFKIEDFITDLKNKGYFEADKKEYERGVKYFQNLYFGTI